MINQVNTTDSNDANEGKIYFSLQNKLLPNLSPVSLQVQIPEELFSFVMNEEAKSRSEIAKYYGFYLLLKAESPNSGWIQNYANQLPELSKKFGITEQDFIKLLIKLEELKIAFRESNDIRTTGWK